MQHEDKFSLEVIAQTYLLFVSKIINPPLLTKQNGLHLLMACYVIKIVAFINTPYSLKNQMYNNQEHGLFHK